MLPSICSVGFKFPKPFFSLCKRKISTGYFFISTSSFFLFTFSVDSIISMSMNAHLCCVDFPLYPWEKCPAFTSNYWYYITVQQFISLFLTKVPCFFFLISIWKTFFIFPIRLRILVPHFPPSFKILAK